MVGGETDRLASMQDYRDLRDVLNGNNSCVFYKEYPYGHLGFLIPPDKTLFDELLELIINFNPDYIPQFNPEDDLRRKQAFESVQEILQMIKSPKPDEQKLITDIKLQSNYIPK